MTDTLQGVLIGAGIGFLGSVIVQLFETWRHGRRLEAEKKQRREEQWFEQVSGPYLADRREAFERLVDMMSRFYGEAERAAVMDELMSLLVYMPVPVVDAVALWLGESRAEGESVEDWHARDHSFRVKVAVTAISEYCKAMGLEARTDFVEDGELPWVVAPRYFTMPGQERPSSRPA